MSDDDLDLEKEFAAEEEAQLAILRKKFVAQAALAKTGLDQKFTNQEADDPDNPRTLPRLTHHEDKYKSPNLSTGDVNLLNGPKWVNDGMHTLFPVCSLLLLLLFVLFVCLFSCCCSCCCCVFWMVCYFFVYVCFRFVSQQLSF